MFFESLKNETYMKNNDLNLNTFCSSFTKFCWRKVGKWHRKIMHGIFLQLIPETTFCVFSYFEYMSIDVLINFAAKSLEDGYCLPLALHERNNE